jgi:hypothetical protein
MRAIVFSLMLVLAGCIDYSDGERTGTVTKFSRKGLICKSWEGEMQMEGFRTGGAGGRLQANLFVFSAEDPSVVPTIQAAQHSGERVTLRYRQEAFVGPCRADTKYFIVSAERRLGR